MATKSTKSKAKAKKKVWPPNDKARRVRTAKADNCQWCGKKVPLKDQYLQYNDHEKDETVKVKIGANRVESVLTSGKSHWCSDCADKRVKMNERWLARRREAGGSTAGSGAKAKAKSKAKATKAKAAGRRASASASASAKKRKRVAPKRKRASVKAKAKVAEPF